MVYILFNNQDVIGLYDSVSLLKQNSFITVYRMMKQGDIEKDVYFKLKSTLLGNFNIPVKELQELLQQVNIYIEYSKVEKNGFYALDQVLKHIEKRFNYLEDVMSKDSRITVTFPGRSAVDNKMLTSDIEERWRSLDVDNYVTIRNVLFKYLIKRIQKLELDFEGRVMFGIVSDTQASLMSYQVWPADQENWNLPENSKIPGDGLAVCFQYQVPGVFGIVTDPLFGYDNL
jgi:hypothetical protein